MTFIAKWEDPVLTLTKMSLVTGEEVAVWYFDFDKGTRSVTGKKDEEPLLALTGLERAYYRSLVERINPDGSLAPPKRWKRIAHP